MCIDPDHGSSHADAASGHAMAGMGMPMDLPDHEAPVAPGESPSNGGAPCDQPVTPGDCQVLAPCAGGALANAPADIDGSARLGSHVLARPALTLSSRTIPPELPPPRA